MYTYTYIVHAYIHTYIVHAYIHHTYIHTCDTCDIQSDLPGFLLRCPGIFCMQLPDLQQKLRYLFKSLGFTPYNLKKFPSYFTYDLVPLIHTYIHMLQYVHLLFKNEYIHTNINLYIYMLYIHTFMHTYMRTYIHTYIHTHM